MPAQIISGVPNMILYVAAAGAIYYFFIYESEEDKKTRLAKDAGK